MAMSIRRSRRSRMNATAMVLRQVRVSSQVVALVQSDQKEIQNGGGRKDQAGKVNGVVIVYCCYNCVCVSS
jgi:hypothetical protein